MILRVVRGVAAPPLAQAASSKISSSSAEWGVGRVMGAFSRGVGLAGNDSGYVSKDRAARGAATASARDKPSDHVAAGTAAAYAVSMIVHLVDGTYELFRHFYSPAAAANGEDTLKGVRGVITSVFGMLEGGATHLGVATDHIIESFRNDLWPGYKTGEGIDPMLFAEFEPLEQALEAMGVVVWAMTEFEADDALAAAAAMAAADPRVTQVVICTPDKDLAQCVRGSRVVQLDRRANLMRDEAGVREKYGVPPESIPDWLALVGDSSDGYPGLPGWGQKSAATVLAAYGHLENIPERGVDWSVKVAGAMRLAATFTEQREQALLFRRLAILRTDAPVSRTVDALLWRGPRPSFAEWCERIGAPQLIERAAKLAAARKAAHAP
jgi:5'-3' exonuclease